MTDDRLPTTSEPPKVKVLAIMGAGRSGSTLLDTVLGSVHGVFSCGELHDLWARLEDGGRRCGCGVPTHQCPLWRSVLGRDGRGDGPLAAIQPASVRTWQRRCARSRHTIRLLNTRADRSPELASLIRVMDQLYRRIAESTGAWLVVDSSKRPSDAALLRLLPGVDPYVVHLVRDPRAVTHSWRRTKRELGAVRRDEHMPRRSVLLSSSVWLELNALGQLVCRYFGADRARLVRYEDLVSEPRRTLTAILEMVGAVDIDLPISDDGWVELKPNHTVGGNPNRFATGRVRIERDDEWLAQLPRSHRWLCSLLCAPLMGRFGYPILSGGPVPSQRDGAPCR